MQVTGSHHPAAAKVVDICQTTPPTSPILDPKPTGSLSPTLSPRITAPALVSESSSRVVSSSTNSSRRRISVPGVQFMLDKIRAKLLTRRQLLVEKEHGDAPAPTSPTETRYFINDRDVRSIIEFVLSQSRDSSNHSSRITSAEFHGSRVPSGTASDMLTSPPSTLGSSCGPERDDVLRRLRELTNPILSSSGTVGPQAAVITSRPRGASQRVMSPTIPEPIVEIVHPFPEEGQRIGGPTRTSDPDIWNLCLARPTSSSNAASSCRTKPAPPTLRTTPVRATTTLKAVQDHAFGSRAERRRSVVSRSDLSVYSHGGESSTDGLTSFPRLRRRRSSEWRTPAELMDRQNERPEGEPL